MTNSEPSNGPDRRAEADPTRADTTTATATRPDGDADPVYDETPAPSGRPVRLEPTPPGFWRVLGGAIVAVLAPFFGILTGSTLGADEPSTRMDPLYWGFFIGCVIGALGLVSVGLGARQLMRNPRPRKLEEEEGP
ncbi:hypothetical protein [Ornithinimicrobium pratense]|uniref:Uncharacterized protein n=1 Tax=Ornithinimicrobium pratense TaxID=2593973 RepID=A0A5J6V6M1_9MICO|nr:hypothetical protein [Ornithinimicrobium pratense]QFG68682.1 hypothetical protein FY030_08105 [Ornithinimicrobium pratense]